MVVVVSVFVVVVVVVVAVVVGCSVFPRCQKLHKFKLHVPRMCQKFRRYSEDFDENLKILIKF